MASAPSRSDSASVVRPARVICVLGMHRSGTSFLAGSLQQLGLFLGKHSTWNPHNLRGNRENRDARLLNDGILSASGGSWDIPPPVVEWKPEHFTEANRILAEYSEHSVWGFKDPRTLLTLNGWESLVPDIEPVGVFRHPERVAQSLKSRGDMPREQALGLWLVYNGHLLEVHRRKPFPILSFDEDAPVLQAKLAMVAELLGFERASIDEPFFSDELRGARADGDPLPTEVQALYEELRMLSL